MESVGRTGLGCSRRGAILRPLLAVTVTIGTGAALPTPAASAQEFVGTDRDDHLVGTAGGDRLRALGGDDVVSARGGRDHVFGGPGNDTVRGGPASELWLGGGVGRDRIFGGDGSDLIGDGIGRDESHGGAGNDLLQTGRGPDVAYGGRGSDSIIFDDTLFSTGSRDSAHGGPGNDFFFIEPDGHPDLIACGPGTDTVRFDFGREALDRLTNCEVVELSEPTAAAKGRHH
jgi:RTX calcium-binding nonapeptide repeat (4 copies)